MDDFLAELMKAEDTGTASLKCCKKLTGNRELAALNRLQKGTWSDNTSCQTKPKVVFANKSVPKQEKIKEYIKIDQYFINLKDTRKWT